MSLQDYIFIDFFNFNYFQGKKEIWKKLRLKLRQDKLLSSQSFHLIYLILEADLSGSGWAIIRNKIQIGPENAWPKRPKGC